MHSTRIVYDSICRNDSNASKTSAEEFVDRLPEQNVQRMHSCALFLTQMEPHSARESCVMYLISEYAAQCMHGVFRAMVTCRNVCMREYDTLSRACIIIVFWGSILSEACSERATHVMMVRFQTLKTHVCLSANQNDGSIHEPFSHAREITNHHPTVWSRFRVAGHCVLETNRTRSQRVADSYYIQSKCVRSDHADSQVRLH